MTTIDLEYVITNPQSYIIVIGCDGFIGSAFVRFSKSNPDFEYKFIFINRKNYKEWKEYIEKYQLEFKSTIWAAGLSSKIYCESNFEWCWEQNVDNLILAIDDFPADLFVYISSYDVYPSFWMPEKKEENAEIDINLLSNYGKTKLEGENIVKRWAYNSYLILRPNAFVGDGLRKNIIYDLLQEEKNIYVTLDSIFQFINTDVFVEILLTFLINNYRDTIFNISGSKSISVSSILSIMGVNTDEVIFNNSSKIIAEMNILKLQKSIVDNYNLLTSEDYISNWRRNEMVK